METTTQNDVKVWTLDPTHSSVHFSVKHMVITKTKGAFDKYTLKVETKGLSFEDAKIELEIDVNSINTNMGDRDTHLKSPDFFDAAKFPAIKFVSTSFKKENEEDYILKGDLTIKGVTKPIEFKATFGGQITDPWGNIRSGFTLHSSIDRFDYDLTWSAALETGSLMVSKEVKLDAEIEIITAK